jgi:ABC-type antimicrobial peptide transport system permease subunit
MLKNYFKITLRSLIKNKLFVFINILGLGVALACTIVAYLSWDFNVKYDVQHVNAGQIYRVNFVRVINKQSIKNGSCPQPLGEVISSNIDQVDEVIRYFPTGGNFKVGDELFSTSVAAVDDNFLDVFTFPLLEGNKLELQQKGQIFISSEMKDKYFPDGPATGEQITYINGSKRLEFIVAGVFEKMPLNSSFQFDALVNYAHVFDIVDWHQDDWAQFNTTFVTVKDPREITGIEDNLQGYVEVQNRAKEDYKVDEYYLDPFAGMAIRAEQEDIWNHWFRSSMPTAAVIAPIIMAGLILLIACFNFTNTSIAIANRRLKEIGIRKVLGSQRQQLIAQFLGENILLTLFALVAGLLIAEILVPAYNEMWPFLHISLDYLRNFEFLSFLVGLLILTGVLAGSYPAFYITGFKPASILRGTLKYGGTSRFTRILLTMQFAISIIAIISGILFAQNAEYQKNYDVGFDQKAVLFAYVVDEEGHNAFKNEIEGYTKIKEIAGSKDNFTSNWYTDPIKFEADELDVDLLDIGDNYLNTTGATVIAGRDFIKDSQSDVENSVLVNEELVKIFGWAEPVGQRLILRDTVELFVVGVVRNLYLRGLWDPVKPALIRYTMPQQYQYVVVQADVADIKEVREFMEVAWKKVFPDRLVNVRYMDENMGDVAEVNGNIKKMFVFLGLIAVILSAIGLFSLVSLNIIKRMKEIGVRKVLGASVWHIVNLVNRQFVIILAIAAILGSIGGYYMTDALMGSIWTYYLPIGPGAFIMAAITLFIISAITVGGKVVAAATANPSTTLRDE